MPRSAALDAGLVELVAQATRRARVTISGTSMEPFLRTGMVVDIEPLAEPPQIGDILVFRSQSGLIAHRLVGGERLRLGSHTALITDRLVDESRATFVTCGDAHPERPEVVSRQLVVGRVCAVWSGADADATRVDDVRFVRRGAMLARTRALRSRFVKWRAYSRLCLALIGGAARPQPVPPAFSALVTATRLFDRAAYAPGVALLEAVPRDVLVEMVRRHHASGLLAQWFDEAVRAGVAVPGVLADRVRRIRLANALAARRVLLCVQDVRDRLAVAGIPHIFLKGGARIAAGEPGADLQFCGDVDVLVPTRLADAAMSALRAGGYRDVQTPRWRSSHASWMHHREPVMRPDIGVPVEVHLELVPPAGVSRRLDYTALAPSVKRVSGPFGRVDMLDDVGCALHLAYHARDLTIWRDIVLLSRLLSRFDDASRTRFDAHVAAETRDGVRLMSAVAAAAALRGPAADPRPAVRRYLAWTELREDLPRVLGSADILESVVGRNLVPKLRLRSRAEFAGWLRCWIRNAIALPCIAGIALRRRRLRSAALPAAK
jgi:hypothetical protein